MAVSQMQKVQIFVHSSHQASLVKDLQDLEIVHINNQNNKESTDEPSAGSDVRAKIRDIQNDLSRLQFAINYLAGFEPKKSLIAGFLGSSKPVFTPQEYAGIPEEFARGEWKSICDECQSMEEQSTRLASRESRLHTEEEHLGFWRDLDAPVEEIHDTEKTAIRMGVVPMSFVDSLIADLESSNLYVAFDVVGMTKAEINAIVMFLKSEEQDVISILTKHEFFPMSLPMASGKVIDQLKLIEEELSEISKQRTEIIERSAQLAQHKTSLMAIYDHLSGLLRQEEAKESLAYTDHTFMIEGWVRKRDIKKLEETLSKKYDELEIIASDPSDDEEPPVDLKNGKLVTPFEMVTKLYALPHYREIDPTPLLATFQAMGFAICLTDAGYGVVLSLVFLIILLATRKSSGGNKKLFGVLLISGITTVVIGTLTGGWFGLSGDKLPSFLLKLRVLDPTTPRGQLIFIGLIVLFGYLEVFFGFAVKMYIYLKERNWLGAFCDQFSWILVMILAPALILLKISGGASIVSYIFLIIIVLCALTIILFVGRDTGNIAGRIGMGLFGLYGNVTGTFGDTLSYMRLFALGLATGIIASSVNAIAGLTWGDSIVSKIGAIAILIFGHPFNITINALGGFIHSARLQFVEFFTKFYEGGGDEFRPFKKEHIYITVVKD